MGSTQIKVQMKREHQTHLIVHDGDCGLPGSVVGCALALPLGRELHLVEPPLIGRGQAAMGREKPLIGKRGRGKAPIGRRHPGKGSLEAQESAGHRHSMRGYKIYVLKRVSIVSSMEIRRIYSFIEEVIFLQVRYSS